ncbi:hypothetical protein V6N13_067342 [Hibiscus sabdariffa]|uniref:Uncharacterized protein n=1 Tax=Hibiscus sabdariffa TaxID=183260 RepID=A0ABR2DUV7_9ROSI
MDLFIKELYGLCLRNGAENSAKVTMTEALKRLTFNVNLMMLVGKRFFGNDYSKVNNEPWRYESAIKHALYLVYSYTRHAKHPPISGPTQ